MALWLLALLLIVIAVNSNEPYLLKLRGARHVVLIAATIIVPIVMIGRGAWRSGMARRLLFIAWCVPLLALLRPNASPRRANTRRCTPMLRRPGCSGVILSSATMIPRKHPCSPAGA
ncbi:MAG TPA: hypothetical protein VFR21_27330 [Bradyrhizobium sp.]|nr:hypothetical protein [Bradyrhizobium sp.]